MPVFDQDAWVDTVSERMEAVVAAGTGLPADCVFLALVPPAVLCQNPPADRFASLCPVRMPVDARLVAGAGAEHTGFDSTWHVNLFGRLGTDHELRSVRFIRDASRGLGAFVKKACVALQLEDLSAGDASAILREPLRLVTVLWNPPATPAGWGWVQTEWQVKFRTDLR